MQRKTRYQFRARVSERKFRDALRLFCADMTADRAVELCSANSKMALALFTLLRAG